MVREIIKNIEERAELELREIEKNKEQEIRGAERDFELDLKIAKEEKRKSLEKRFSSILDDFEARKRSEAGFAFQKAKREILSEAYKKAEDKLLSFSDKEFEAVISALFKKVPELKSMKISAGKKTAPILKKLAKNVPVDAGLGEEGFVVIGESVEFDFRISGILKFIRQKADPEIVKIIFS
ncbi:MAG: hypothetical protein A2365_03050 [Candidatus Nealsonbacteria bacterium RIFOXYB1_FULL_40_15]|uniref:V-type proton ATPase subunit E n=2 Tax=Candidatus Nealsoniibacteriota TaxID=1817911 RepID=A0A1G2ETM6_9BACT|nr:MAG: hypothetical protein A2365_03050 [Candidatus Nealsonbacteria bacterium RIFOXYB1_FULL_40_15]OGZ29205.1 MAG: hypothetical protein A2427_02905 [Candidatus Nealsonbacteria bacterium RIFOXYC1_FULL_40_7]OGZ29887.1 MAG: hypothetical protein A2562_02085 [Candidatus Nealsonbacteria bacterium RIFOXYD1_FULL_39_11]